MNPTDNQTQGQEQDFTPDEQDYLCVNCHYGEWRHNKDFNCQQFDNGLATKQDTYKVYCAKCNEEIVWPNVQCSKGHSTI